VIELKPSPLAYVSPGVPSLLQPGYYVKFSDAWPATLSHVTYQDAQGFTRGKFFQVEVTNQVNYDLSYKIPVNDFRDVDFGNTATGFNENLYPTNPKTLYETQIGFKEANLLAIFYIPAGEPLSRLEQANMIPPVALPFGATLRYLGAKKPSDSPYYDKRIYLYSVFNMEPLIMRLFVDNGVDFDKVVVGLVVNKCSLTIIDYPTQEMLNRAKVIKYYTEERW
jgi:hypothetical protein